MNRRHNYLLRVLLFTALLFGLTHVSADALTGVAPTGQPGLSFRYVETFGETGVPYLADSDHLYWPPGVAVDNDDNLWIAEEYGTRVMKFSGDGTFLMSIGTPGLTYLADETHFAGQTDVSVDPDGNPWVSDSFSNRVVKFDASGNYQTQFGVAWEGGEDNAHLNWPRGTAFDSSGRIYVADTGNQRIQVFDSSGVYSTTIGVAGEPGSDNGHFNAPQNPAIDESGFLFVADTNNHRVQIFDASYTYTATLGVAGVPGSDNNHLDNPRAVAVDTSYIYVADSGNHRVQIFDRATRSYQDTLGWGAGNYAFDWPSDVAVDSAGNLYIADLLHHRVQKFNNSLAYVRTFGVTGVPYLTDGAHYNQPTDVAVDGAGNIGIIEGWGRGHRFIKLDANGTLQFTIGNPGICGDANDQLCNPNGVTFDSVGNIYVGDCGNNRVQIYTSSGAYAGTLGSSGQGDYQFACPSGLAFDSNGDFYVADSGNYRVQIFDSSLAYKATLGETGVPGSDNGHFNAPDDVAVDSAGNIYVTDPDTRVQVFDSTYAYVGTLGVTGEVGNDFDHFYGPHGVEVDAEDNVYVADQANTRVQVFDASGAYLTTIGGASGDLSSQLRDIYGVGLDSQGNVYIPDALNSRIQKFTPGVPGWQQSNLNGFGDPQTTGIFSLAPFADRLYAGTVNFSGSGAQIWHTSDGVTWAPAMSNGFGMSYNVGVNHMLEFSNSLYASTVADEANGGELWRSMDGQSWTRVASQGFGDPSNAEVNRLVVFKDQLYASTWSYTDAHGTELWRSLTGNTGTWQRVANNGFDGDANNAAILSLIEFNDYLYAGTWNTATGGEVWRSNNGAVWSQVNTDGFGAANNRGVSALAAYKGYLYAAARGIPDVSGDQVWRCQLCDGSDWYRVVDNGFGSVETSGAAAMQVFHNALYLAAGNAVTGMEVWRLVDGNSWEQVGFAGFGDSNNYQPYWGNSISTFDGHLMIGTINRANGGEIWRYYLQDRSLYLPMIQR